jgi:hypothetical protein
MSVRVYGHEFTILIDKKIIFFFRTGYFVPPCLDGFNKYIYPICTGRLICNYVFHDSIFLMMDKNRIVEKAEQRVLGDYPE